VLSRDVLDLVERVVAVITDHRDGGELTSPTSL